MKTNTIQQEVLLATTTTLSKREWCSRDASENRQFLSHKEVLEEACWNGLLNELLPEIMEKSATGKRLILRNIRGGKYSLAIELGEFSQAIEKQYSINSNSFLPAMTYN